jgi:hypothetical protein
MLRLVPFHELSIHYTYEVDKGVGLVLVEVVKLGIFPDRGPLNRVYASESGRSARREIVVGFPEELEPREKLRRPRDFRGEGEPPPVALLDNESLVPPYPEGIGKDLC